MAYHIATQTPYQIPPEHWFFGPPVSIDGHRSWIRFIITGINRTKSTMPQSNKPSHLSYRSRHRAAAHNSAHAQASEVQSVIIHDPLVPAGPAKLIDTQAGLLELVDHLSQAGCFGYDSEFIGELTYIPRLCLIQVASSQRVALIDPQASLDLTPFWQLLCDEKIEKIVHAGQQDVEPVMRLHQSPASNIFDTQIAAGFVGLGYPVSLSRLSKEMMGVKLGKGLTFSHWDQRPLSAMQLHYAAEDVRYLPALHRELGKKLQSYGHTQWAAEECAAMAQVRLYQFDPQMQANRIRGAISLTGQGLAILRELLAWRDELARRDNVPPRSLVRDEVLMDLARSPVKSVEKLNRVRGLPKPVEAAHGQEIVDAIGRACALPKDQLPQTRQIEESPAEKFNADSLWAMAQCLSAGCGIDPSLVTSRQEIGELHRALINGGVDQENMRLLSTWRRQAVGDPLLKLFRHHARAAFHYDAQGLRSTLDPL